jgi:heptose I phosphotransferase
MNDRRQSVPLHPGRLLPSVGDSVTSLWSRLRRGSRLVRKAADWERFAGDDWLARNMTRPVTDRFHANHLRSNCRLSEAVGSDRLGV